MWRSARCSILYVRTYEINKILDHYKVCTGVIAQLNLRNLLEWAIPREQLARARVWATCQGMLMDKGHSQAARLKASAGLWKSGRPYNHLAWSDFTKAYDSIHDWQLLRLISVLPLPIGVVNALRAAVRRWSIIIHWNPVQRDQYESRGACTRGTRLVHSYLF